MKEKILNLLRQADGYLSGQGISQLLGVSRTAVWKSIRKLQEDGYQIEAVTNRGYRLIDAAGPDLMNQYELDAAMRTKWAGHPVLYKEKTGSTNDDIQTLSDEGYPEGTLVISSCQTAGRGRRGRTWISPEDGNIYMSILLRPQIEVEKTPMCTLIMALAVWEALADLYGGESGLFGIKWPNDIVARMPDGQYKKLAGILTQMRLEDTEIRDVVIGTGINANIREFPPEISSTATSIAQATGGNVNRVQLTAGIWVHFEQDYERFLECRSLAPLRTAYEKALVNKGREVRVLDPAGEYTGTAAGITTTGELIVTPDGAEAPVFVGAGEISVRGVMGYV